MEGQGRLTLTDGCFYECSWHLGQPQTGRWSSADERTEYEGQFKGMLWHGFGTVHQTGVRKYMGKAVYTCSQLASSTSQCSPQLCSGKDPGTNSSGQCSRP